MEIAVGTVFRGKRQGWQFLRRFLSPGSSFPRPDLANPAPRTHSAHVGPIHFALNVTFTLLLRLPLVTVTAITIVEHLRRIRFWPQSQRILQAPSMLRMAALKIR